MKERQSETPMERQNQSSQMGPLRPPSPPPPNS